MSNSYSFFTTKWFSLEDKGWRSMGEGWKVKDGCGVWEPGCLTILFCSPQLMLFLRISSSWVKTRLNTKNQLPRLPGIGILFFIAPHLVLILYIPLNWLTKFVGEKINFLGCLESFYFLLFFDGTLILFYCIFLFWWQRFLFFSFLWNLN